VSTLGNSAMRWLYRNMKTHHFIISYDSISKQWVHDIDQEEIHYNDGTVWSEITQQWASGYLGDGEHDQEDADLCEKINDALEQLNKTNK
jgi:hypothetical protein